MGNKKNKTKKRRRSHIINCRAIARRTNAKRWSDRNIENNETVFPSNEYSSDLQNDADAVPSSSSLTPLTTADMNIIESSSQLRKTKGSKEISSKVFFTPLLPPADHGELLLPVNINSEEHRRNIGPTCNENGTLDLTEPYLEEKETDCYFQPVQGRRIVDINYLFAQLQEKGHHNGLFDCKSAYFKLVGERRIGLISKFKFICDVCKEVVVINSEKDNDTENVNANIAATTGIVCAGIGYSQFEEILSAMNIPIFSSKFYGDLQNQVYEKWEEIAVQSMEAAAEKEKEAAIAEGRVLNDIPMIDVFVDGCWCARSRGSGDRAGQ